MRFPEFVRTQPRGWVKRLDREGVASESSLRKLVAGGVISDYLMAERISDATGGAVTIPELCKPPAKRRRRS